MGKVTAGINDLITTHPELAAEWHPTKNGELTPQTIPSNYTSKVWWQCTEGHEWKATPSRRVTKLQGCQFCSSERPNSFSSAHPDLSAEWHPTKNGELTPQTIPSYYASKLWWMCSAGHEWEATPYKRIKKSEGCPTCCPEITNTFKTRHPEMAAEWHPTKNGELTPDIPPYYPKKVWWQCVKGHEWAASPNTRVVKSQGCPACFPSISNPFSSAYPELAAQWHPTKNGDLTPHTIPRNYGANIWWLCDKGHQWEATPNKRKKNSECFQCFIYLYVAATDKTLLPELHPAKNIDIRPDRIKHPAAANSVKLWWQCSKGHEWQNSIEQRSKGKMCPICSGNQVIEGETDLMSCYPFLATEWHPTKNEGKRLKDISIYHNTRRWWVCAKGHEWRARITDMGQSYDGGTGCPVCKNYEKLGSELNPAKSNPSDPYQLSMDSQLKVDWVCSEGHEWKCEVKDRVTKGNQIKDCPLCESISLLEAEWNPKNIPFSSDLIKQNSQTKYWWICPEGHEWEESPSSRGRRNKFNPCPVCVNKMSRVKTGLETLDITHPELSQELHPTKNGSIRAEDVTHGSNNKYWWMCSKGHEWQSFISNRVKGYNCPQCG